MGLKLPDMAKIATRDGGWFCSYCHIPLVPNGGSRWGAGIEGCTRTRRGGWSPPPGMAWPQRDHVIPLSRGGRKMAIVNLVLACWPCNREKFNRTGDEYRAFLLEAALLDLVGR